MNKFYVRDGNNIKYFGQVNEVVKFLEQVVKLKLKMSRAEWMQHNMELGSGPDDSTGVVFTETMASQVEIGVVQKENRHVRCNIFEATQFKTEGYGD